MLITNIVVATLIAAVTVIWVFSSNIKLLAAAFITYGLMLWVFFFAWAWTLIKLYREVK